MRASKGRMFVGIVVLFSGIFMLLNYLQFIEFRFALIWPMFLLIPGLIFEFGYFFSRRKNHAQLVPGGILTVYGLVFFLEAYYGWAILSPVWPFLLLGVAFGLFQLYAFGYQDRSLLLPMVLLTVLGLSNILQNYYDFDFELAIPVILILSGLFLIIKKR
jgi:hypothetical protein